MAGTEGEGRKRERNRQKQRKRKEITKEWQEQNEKGGRETGTKKERGDYKRVAGTE